MTELTFEPLFERELIMGVDPGFSGAIAVYNPKSNRLVDVIDFPVTTGKKPEILISEFADFISTHASSTRLCVIEDVGAMTGVEGRQSMFRFGFATGVAHGVIGSFLIPIVTTKPAVWKTLMGLSREKRLSIEKARAMFPTHSQTFTSKHDGRAEAALLAVFGKRIPS